MRKGASQAPSAVPAPPAGKNPAASAAAPAAARQAPPPHTAAVEANAIQPASGSASTSRRMIVVTVARRSVSSRASVSIWPSGIRSYAIRIGGAPCKLLLYRLQAQLREVLLHLVAQHELQQAVRSIRGFLPALMKYGALANLGVLREAETARKLPSARYFGDTASVSEMIASSALPLSANCAACPTLSACTICGCHVGRKVHLA